MATTAASSRPRRHATADLPVATATTKYKLQSEGRTEQGGSKTNGLLEIRAEMPTMDDSWDVEAVVQYRTYYRKEQWLIKWQGYGEDRNTWHLGAQGASAGGVGAAASRGGQAKGCGAPPAHGALGLT